MSELSHHCFLNLVASWHSLESSKKGGDVHLFCFIYNKEIQPSGRTDSVVCIKTSVSRGRGGPWSLKLFTLNQSSCLDAMFPRTEMCWVAFRAFPRDSRIPQQQWANRFIVEINIQLKKSSCFWQPHVILGRQRSRLEIQRHGMFIVSGSVFLLYQERRLSLGKRNGLME